MSEKIKVAIFEGPENVADFLGETIEIVTDLNKANIVIIAEDKDISPEFYYSKTKDESMHDSAKDYRIYSMLNNLRRTNPYAIVIGLRGGAGFIDVIRGNVQCKQKEIFDTKESYKARGITGSLEKCIMNTYTTNNYCYPSTAYSIFDLPINGRTYNYIAKYPSTTRYNCMISIHCDPLLIDKDDISLYIIKNIILNYIPLNGLEIPIKYIDPRKLSDVSIWGSRSDILELNNSIEPRACFGTLVKYGLARHANYNNKLNIEYTINVCTPKSWNSRYGRCVTFFKYEEYKEYYERLQQLYPFDYTVTENEEYTTIKLKIDACCMWHKIILTQLRYIYQYPMHFILKDALELKKINEFKDMDILDLLNIVSKTISRNVDETGEYMIYPYGKYYDRDNLILKPINDKEFRDLAEAHAKEHEVPLLNSLGEKYTVEIAGFKYIKDTTPCFINWDIFSKTFDIRFPFYLHNINVFINRFNLNKR